MKSLEDCWIIGDHFLRETFSMFSAMAASAKTRGRPRPYLFDYFNVIHAFSRGNGVRSTIARIRNALVEMVNERDHLPKFLIVVADKDIVTYINHVNFGVSLRIQRCIDWLINNIERIITTRQEDIRSKRPGGVRLIPTQVVWVKMLARPIEAGRSYNNVLSLKSKFNFILEESLASKGQKILEIESMGPADFDRNSNLTTTGKEQFWKELDYRMKKFDRAELDLTAVKNPQSNNSNGNGQGQDRRRLPEPPRKSNDHSYKNY